ncbi:hypothetical protein [Bordetella trematum]|uniref:hypothetical protein n=1 Tax=Bordetella trematum TaxID=123899 RepID=UPI003AF34737
MHYKRLPDFPPDIESELMKLATMELFLVFIPNVCFRKMLKKTFPIAAIQKYRDNEISKKNNARSYSLLNALMAQYGDYRLQTLIQYAQLSGCLFEQQETDFFENKKMGHLRVDEIKFKKGCSLEDVGVLYGVVKVAVMPISTSVLFFLMFIRKMVDLPCFFGCVMNILMKK